MPKQWSGNSVMKARRYWSMLLPQPCGQCHRPVNPGDKFVVGHVIPRTIRPDLMFVIDNQRVEHAACSAKSSTSVVIEKAKHEARQELLAELRRDGVIQ